MANENYYNHYIDVLTNTMTDAIIRNVSLQASVRVGEETIKELNKTIELMDAEIGQIREGETARISNLENEISQLNNELIDLRKSKSEYENVRTQAQHVDTFKNELLKARDEIKKLNEQIDYLQLPPAKRKKIDDSKSKESTNEPVEDGGTF